MMTGMEYKAALAALGLDHEKAAERLGIGLRTSHRYATKGAPPRIATTLDLMISAQRKPRQKKAA